jgi:hypothetical protein
MTKMGRSTVTRLVAVAVLSVTSLWASGQSEKPVTINIGGSIQT